MTIIQWLSADDRRSEGVVPGRSGLSLRRCIHERRIDGRTRKGFYAALIACAMIGPGLPLTAWTADLSSLAPVNTQDSRGSWCWV